MFYFRNTNCGPHIVQKAVSSFVATHLASRWAYKLIKDTESESFNAILSWQIYYRVWILDLISLNMKVSENNPESPYLGEIKRMRKQCVQGTSPFSVPVYEANKNIAHISLLQRCCLGNRLYNSYILPWSCTLLSCCAWHQCVKRPPLGRDMTIT